MKSLHKPLITNALAPDSESEVWKSVNIWWS